MKISGVELSNKQLKKIIYIGTIIFGVFLFVKSFILDTDKKDWKMDRETFKKKIFKDM